MRKLSKIATGQKLRPDSEEEMVPTDIRYDGAMSELGQNAKNSIRANVFRSYTDSGHPRRARGLWK
jgi:hypothetical protein